MSRTVSVGLNQPFGTADKILDFFLRMKRFLAKYTKEEKQKAAGENKNVTQLSFRAI